MANLRPTFEKIETGSRIDPTHLRALMEVRLEARQEVLFCRPTSAQHVADSIDLEVLALEELGVGFAQIAIEPVVHGEPELALEAIEEQPGRRWLYRGWMLDEEEYGRLDEALADRGEQLVVSAEEMAEAAYVPNWYETLRDHTADTRWTYHDVDTQPPPLDAFGYLDRIDSPFFTADVARLIDGRWMVIELNDGGMSTLPELMDPRDLYRGVFR